MAETHSLQDMRQQAAVAAKVFIQRDYTNGTVCQFQTKFPSDLETRIDKTQFEETVRTLNNLYAEAEKLGSQSYIEGCLACLTAYTVFLCMETHYEKVLKKIAKYVQEQNDKIYAPRGLLLTDPIERGLRVVSTLVSDVVEKNCLLSSVRVFILLTAFQSHLLMMTEPYFLFKGQIEVTIFEDRSLTR